MYNLNNPVPNDQPLYLIDVLSYKTVFTPEIEIIYLKNYLASYKRIEPLFDYQSAGKCAHEYGAFNKFPKTQPKHLYFPKKPLNLKHRN